MSLACPSSTPRRSAPQKAGSGPAANGTKFAERGVKGSEPVDGAVASCQAGASVGYSFSTDHGVSRTLDESSADGRKEEGKSGTSLAQGGQGYCSERCRKPSGRVREGPSGSPGGTRLSGLSGSELMGDQQGQLLQGVRLGEFCFPTSWEVGN